MVDIYSLQIKKQYIRQADYQEEVGILYVFDQLHFACFLKAIS